jgi:hypothetical protein
MMMMMRRISTQEAEKIHLTYCQPLQQGEVNTPLRRTAASRKAIGFSPMEKGLFFVTVQQEQVELQTNPR